MTDGGGGGGSTRVKNNDTVSILWHDAENANERQGGKKEGRKEGKKGLRESEVEVRQVPKIGIRGFRLFLYQDPSP